MGEEVKLRFLTLNRTLLSHNNYFSLKLTFKRGPLTYTACNLSEKLLLCLCLSFFHHYQGSIDFNTVNIHRTVGMYFLISTGNRGDIE